MSEEDKKRLEEIKAQYEHYYLVWPTSMEWLIAKLEESEAEKEGLRRASSIVWDRLLEYPDILNFVGREVADTLDKALSSAGGDLAGKMADGRKLGDVCSS